MGIYSANRVSGLNSGTIKPDMSYVGTYGLGRCMYESAVNDVLLDESMLMQDYAEVKSIREGAMSAADLRPIQEANVRGFFKSAKELLQKLGRKISAIFRTVYAKITQFLVKGKAYAKLHRATVLSKDVSGLKIKKYRKPTSYSYDSAIAAVKMSVVNYSVESQFDREGTPEEFGKSKLEGYLSGQEVGKYSEWMMNKCYEKEQEISASSLKLEAVLKSIEMGSKPVANLKKAEKELTKKIKEAISALGKFESKNKDAFAAKGIPYTRAELSALQTAVNTITKACVGVAKFSIKQDRSIIAQVLAYSATAESGILLYEAAADVSDEVDELIDSPESVEVAEGMPEFDEIEVDASDDE